MICGFKIEISGYLLEVPIMTYSPYKYEVNRTKTHEIRAKCFVRFFSPHYTFFEIVDLHHSLKKVILFFSRRCLPPFFPFLASCISVYLIRACSASIRSKIPKRRLLLWNLLQLNSPVEKIEKVLENTGKYNLWEIAL